MPYVERQVLFSRVDRKQLFFLSLKVANMSILKFFTSRQQRISFGARHIFGGIVTLICLVLVIILPRFQSGVTAESGLITRVDLVRLSVEKLPGDDRLFVTAHLKNASKSNAQAISFGLRDEGGDLQFSLSESSTSSRGAGVFLEPAQELIIPLAPLSEFLTVFQSKCPGCYFLGLGKEVNMPAALIPPLCGGLLEKGKKCHIEYSIFPIFIAKHFTTVSGEKFSGGHPVFVYFSRDTKTEYVVPKN
jgi:hypothetical protein